MPLVHDVLVQLFSLAGPVQLFSLAGAELAAGQAGAR
jgi:hypothetical protein